jgi:hypothetical protein
LAESEVLFCRLPEKAFFFRIRFEDIRRVNLPSFQHSIFYFIHQDSVVVLGVLQGARETEKELASRRRWWLRTTLPTRQAYEENCLQSGWLGFDVYGGVDWPSSVGHGRVFD